MSILRIAVVGAGDIGRAHMEIIQQNSRCRLVAVADPTEAALQLAQSLDIHWFASLEELLNTAKVDGVVLATPNALHVSQALMCIEAGIPVLVEKPISHSVEEAKKLALVVQKSQAKLLVGHHRAHSPIMTKAKALISEGRIGRLVSVMGSAVFFKPDSYFANAPWRCKKGGGPALINLVHEIHNMRMLCGEILEVQAMRSNATRGFEVEDTVALNLRFRSGVLASFMLSDTSASPRSWEQTSQENKAYASYPEEDCYVIAGTMGSLSIPTMRLKTYLNLEDRSWFKPFHCEVSDLQRDDPLKLQMDHFLDVIQFNALPCVTAHDGLQNLLVIDAIEQAMSSRQTVTLN